MPVMHISDKVDYILEHYEQPDLEIAQELDETRYFVWLVKEVQRNERLQPKEHTHHNITNQIKEDPDKMTTKDVAISLDKSVHYVRKKLVNGKLDGHKEQRIWVIEQEDFEEFQRR